MFSGITTGFVVNPGTIYLKKILAIFNKKVLKKFYIIYKLFGVHLRIEEGNIEEEGREGKTDLADGTVRTAKSENANPIESRLIRSGRILIQRVK